MAVIRGEYCTSSPGLLKWFGIIVAGVILGLLLWDYSSPGNLHAAEQYVVFVAAFTIAVCLLILIIFFLDLHHSFLHGCHCHNMIHWIFLILAILWLVAGAVETWYTVDTRGHGSRWVGMRASAAALSFLNALLFGSAMQQTRVITIYHDI